MLNKVERKAPVQGFARGGYLEADYQGVEESMAGVPRERGESVA